MVETLLLLNDLPEHNNTVPTVDVSSQSASNSHCPGNIPCSDKKLDEKPGISMQTIKKVFPTILENFPSTVLKILDSQVQYEGKFRTRSNKLLK